MSAEVRRPTVGTNFHCTTTSRNNEYVCPMLLGSVNGGLQAWELQHCSQLRALVDLRTIMLLWYNRNVLVLSLLCLQP